MSANNVTIDGIEYTVEIRPGTEVTLSDLDHDQRVRCGDGKTNHELLTPVERTRR